MCDKAEKFIEEFNNLSEKEQNDLKEFVKSEGEMKLPDGRVIKFTTEQYDGIQNIRKWLKNNKSRFFTLSGYAGTGKTTIIKKIIDEYQGGLVVSAPTHKAKKVIMRTTQQNGETLHSLLGLRPDVDLDDFNPNDPKYNPIAQPRISSYNLVIIDEASMINQELFDLIKKEVEYWETIKVLFMGDPAQIPPIGEKKSVVFFDEKIVDKHQLTKVMRQEDGNPLFPVYDALRNNLKMVNGGFERKSATNSKGEGIIFTKNKREFRKKLLNTFNSLEYENDVDFVKLIAWRNVTVIQSNKIIREHIFGKDALFLVTGDVLMAYRSIRDKRQYFNLIDNSADYKIRKVSKLITNKFDLKGYQVSLRETLGNGKFENKKVFIIDHTDHENLHNYAEIHDTLKLIAKQDRTKWGEYYDFRRESLLMTSIQHYRDGRSRMYENVIAKDLDYGYAITCHKSQGSTYTHVFVLEDDININPKIQERNQIKYVALTRPTTTATILTNM